MWDASFWLNKQNSLKKCECLLYTSGEKYLFKGVEKSMTSEIKSKGYFGEFGGSFIPGELQEVMDILETEFLKYKDDPEFIEEFRYYLKEYVGRENPLTLAKNLTEKVGGAKIYL